MRAHINPDILVWARQTAGYGQEDAAKKLGVSLDTLHKWEAGEGFPTLRQLRIVGNVYKRPTAIFYKTITPSVPPKLPDFRLIHGEHQEYTPHLLIEIRRAFERRKVALELASQLDEQVPHFVLTAKLTDKAEQVAQALRKAINIPVENQYAWKDHYEAFRNWVSSIESLGVLVFHVNNVEIEQMRGFSIGEHPFPVVAVNGKDSPRGRIFTLFHELAHIIIHNSGVCNLYDEEDHPHHNVEAFCNQVAGEFLVPSDALLNQDIVASNQGNNVWDDWQLNSLANKFMVSQEVILRRLVSLKRTTEQFYKQKRAHYLKIYTQRKSKSTDGFMPFYRRVLRTNGRTYTNLVLNAYNNEEISSRDLSNFLGGIKLDHVNKIAQEMAGNRDEGLGA